MAEVFVGIGSNVQAPRHIAAALRELAAEFGEITASPVYQNPALGFVGDDFLNLVTGFETSLAIEPLNERLHEIERRAGRDRQEARWGPRTLDLDLLLYGDEIRKSPPLPRPDILRRAFVLRPLADLAGQLRHPLTGKTYAEHWAVFEGPPGQLTRVELSEPAGCGESKS